MAGVRRWCGCYKVVRQRDHLSAGGHRPQVALPGNGHLPQEWPPAAFRIRRSLVDESRFLALLNLRMAPSVMSERPLISK
jgi:hypothetical protein